ncbi:MAG: O-antigen ligase family protein [Thalassospira sp.]|uniref:O-antigen ligase family protein n=1 Tax=Thalassospira sp. TaxID=1912094 RepID=UPI003A8C1242
MAQIVLAPLLLGGARPWAIAILSIMSGLGILAVCITRKQISIPRYLIRIWGVAVVMLGWSLLQSLPIWPMQDYPFNATQIALYPNAWMGLAANLIWLIATITLSSLLAQGRSQTLLNGAIKVVIASSALQVGLAALASTMDWQTTFWFGKSAHLDDWTGSFANRNAFGIFLGFGLLGGLYLFAQNKAQGIGRRLDQSGGLLALALIFAVALLESHSRSAVALTLIGTLIFLTLNTPQTTFKVIGKRALFVGFGILALIILIDITSPELSTRFIELARSDLIQRDDAWHTAILAIQDRPITGFGFDSVALVMGHFATAGLNTNAHWFSSHNLLLDAAIMFGIPATLTVLTALGLMATNAVICAPNGTIRAFVLALVSMAMIGSLIGWVMSMPALILPIAIAIMACREAAPARTLAMHQPADPMAQSPVPDQTASR